MISIESLSAYRVLRERTLTSPIQFRTASGEQVQIAHECMLEVYFPTIIEHDDHDKTKLVRYEIRAVVGPVEHNLLSVSGLTRMGATFEFGPEGCHVRVGDIRRMECEIWANVPWLRAHRRKTRSKDQDVHMGHALEAWSEHSSDASPKSSCSGKSSKASERSILMSPETSDRSPSKGNHVKVC